MTVQPPDEEEHISKRVVYEHTTSARQNTGAIIAIIVIAIATIIFIFLQMGHRKPKRSGELHHVLTSGACFVASSLPPLSH